MRLFVFYLGLVLFIVGLAYPLGIANANIFKYILYIGIIAFGIGVLLLPGKLSKSKE